MSRDLPFYLESRENQWPLGPDCEVREIEQVYLIGLREHKFSLLRVTLEEYRELSPQMRGMPIKWSSLHKTLLFWPTPIHHWRGMIVAKEKAAPPPTPMISGAQPGAKK